MATQTSREDPRLRNRTIVITGASSGIGRAAAEAFAAQGADIVLAARRGDALEKAAQACRRLGATTLTVAADVTDGDEMKQLVDAAIDRFGRIDVWINNAGVGAIGRFEETPLAVHRKILDVNLAGILNGAHAVIPHFKARGRGVLINTLSLGAWVTTPYAAAYSASKFGARALSEAIRAELHALPDVHVCDIYPTFVDTPGFMHAGNYSGREITGLSGGMDPREVADAMVHVARRPRDTTVIGGPQAAIGRLAHGLAPNIVARIAAFVFERALRERPSAGETSGAILQPVHAGREIDNPRGRRAQAVRVAPGVAAAAALLAVGVAAAAVRPR